MRIFSRVYNSRIESIIERLGIESEGLVFGPDTEKAEAEAVLRILERNTLVFIPEHLKGLAAGLSLMAVPYGRRLNPQEGDIYTDNCEASIHFTYPDPDTAELAYALALAFQKDITVLENISFRKDECVTVSSEAEAIAAARRLVKSEKTLLVYDAKGYSDVRGLASAFSGFDAVAVNGDSDNARKLEKALDRVIFSPLVRRLSAVLHSTDEAFCDKMRKEYGRVVRLTLIGEEL